MALFYQVGLSFSPTKTPHNPVAKMIQLPIALQMYSLHDVYRENPLKGLEMAAAAGYQAVELYGNGYSPELYAAMLRHFGLCCCGWHTSIEELESNFDGVLQRNLAVGSKFICVPAYQNDTAQGWVEFALRLNAVADKLAPYGISTGYHCHDWDFKAVEGLRPWEIVAENTAPSVVLQLDTGNTAEGGVDVLAALGRYPGRNRTIHFKAFSKENPEAPAGEDQLPWAELMEWCEGPGRTEWIVVEYEFHNHPEEKVAQALKYLRSLRPV